MGVYRMRRFSIGWLATVGPAAFGPLLSTAIAVEYGDPVPAYYDVRSGNLTIDTTNVYGGTSIGYAFRTPGNSYRIENYTPFMDTQFVSVTGLGFAEANLEGIVGGVYSLGDVLPPGLSEKELRGGYFSGGATVHYSNPTYADYVYFASGSLGSGYVHFFEPVYAPSPFPALNDDRVVGLPEITNWASQVSLEYRSPTGELVLHSDGPNGGTIWSYEISLSEDRLNAEAFLPATDGLLAKAEPSKISEVGFHGIPAGEYDLGSVLPSGLNREEFSLLVEEAWFTQQPGHGVVPLDYSVSGINMSVTYVVPEPAASTSLLATAVLALVFRRSRLWDRIFHDIEPFLSGMHNAP